MSDPVDRDALARKRRQLEIHGTRLRVCANCAHWATWQQIERDGQAFADCEVINEQASGVYERAMIHFDTCSNDTTVYTADIFSCDVFTPRGDEA